MLSANLTVCIFAWNEAKRIGRCIQNFEGLFEILVVDNNSTDETVAEVERVGHRAIRVGNPGFIETPEVMDRVFEACMTDFILIASVSEFIPRPLLERYAEVADGGQFDLVRAYRQSITAGQPVPISGKPGIGNYGENRFFRKGAINFVGNKLHGRGQIACPSDRVLSVIDDPALHFFQFRDYDCSKTERVNAVYDDVLAKQRFDSGQRFNFIVALLFTMKRFAACYLRFGCWRYGMHGFLLSYYFAQVEFTVWLRIWEWESGHDLTNVMLANDAVRRRVEDEFRSNN